MIDPGLIAGTPFRSKTAYEDLVGTVSVIHSGLIVATQTITGASVGRFLYDSGAPQEDLLEQIAAQNKALARALGLVDPPDLESYDLRKETDWVSWVYVLARDLSRLKVAAGVV